MVGCKGSGWVWPQWLFKIQCKCAHMYVCVCLHACVVLCTCLCSRMQTGWEKPDGNVIVSATLLPVSRYQQFVCCFIHSAYRRWHCLGKWGFHSFKQNTCDSWFRLNLCTFGSTISEIVCFGSAVFLKLCPFGSSVSLKLCAFGSNVSLKMCPFGSAVSLKLCAFGSAVSRDCHNFHTHSLLQSEKEQKIVICGFVISTLKMFWLLLMCETEFDASLFVPLW